MWPFKSKPRRERAVVNFPGNWATAKPSGWNGGGGGGLPPMVGHTGDPWGGLDPNWLPEISPRAAESVAAVGAAITAIASTLASLPAAVVRADEVRDEVPTHDLARLIRNGVDENSTTWSEFIETLVSTCLLRGNAVASIDTDNRGRLATLPPTVGRHHAPDHRRRPVAVRLPAADATDEHGHHLRAADVLLFRDRSDDDLLGTSRIRRAAGALGYAIQIQSTAQCFPPTSPALAEFCRARRTSATTSRIG